MAIDGKSIYETGLRPGEPVEHAYFGQGVILEFASDAQQRRALVRFEREGDKWIVSPEEYLSRSEEEKRLAPAGSTAHEAPSGWRSGVSAADGTGPRLLPKPERFEAEERPAPGAVSRRGLLKRFFGVGVAAATLTPGMALAGKGGVASRQLPVLETRIAGFAYYDGDQCLARIRSGDALRLRREADNRHDARAVEVFWRSLKIGYVPRSHNQALCRLMDARERIVTRVIRVEDRTWEPVVFEVGVRV